MLDKVKVILNPRGGPLTEKMKMASLEEALDQAGLSYSLHSTRHQVHGYELARDAAQEGYAGVVAAGGDGMIHYVLNGMMQWQTEGGVGPLGIIPMGTANDLADTLGLPRDIKAACRRIAAGNTHLLDVGQVNDHYFLNNSAVGMEPVVTMAQDRLRRLKGKGRYVVAALKSIIGAQAWSMRITWNANQYEGPVTLVSVGNSNRTGGSFYMTPQAAPDDGLLDFVYAMGMGRWQMLRLLPQTLKGGHIHHPLVLYARTAALSISASPPTPVQADGEIIDARATQINYRIIPQKLLVII